MKKILKTKQNYLLFLLVVYLATRMIALLSIPIFLDEAIHLETAKVAMAGNPYAGAWLGKWLSIQFYGLVLRGFGRSLFVARLIPVILGLLTVSVLFALGRTSGKQERTVPAIFGALLYVLMPYSLFYDRLALTDQFLTVLLAFIFLFTFRIVEKPKRFDQVGLGMAILLSPLFKFNGLLFVPVPIIITFVLVGQGQRIRRLRDISLSYLLSTGCDSPISVESF